jgi:protease-4
MIYRRLRRAAALGAATLAGLLGAAPALAVPPRASEPVPDPGKGITNADDTSAIARNPANLVFLPGPELRWNLVWTGESAPLPNRGMSFAAGLPIGPFATGLRLDLLDPPGASPAPFAQSYQWLRWGLAVGSEEASVGTTLGWSFSRYAPLDGYFSLTSGGTWRPIPSLSVSFVARDWNQPVGKTSIASASAGQGALGGLGALATAPTIERSWVWGLGGRPFGSRVFEAAWDLTYLERSKAFSGHGMLGLDIPRVGKVRGDLTVYPETDRRFLATAGVEVNVDRVQASAGGVFGNAIGRASTGFYLGAALHAFREPGLRLPAKVVRVKINETPGVRGNTRLLRKLWRLADDPEVEGVVLQLRAEPAGSLAHAEEVADAVRLLRARGKKVMCHLEDAGGKALFVCAQADRVAMNPAGGLRFSGLGSSYYYLGGLLKKLGVRADFVRIGAHKLAAEQLTLDRGSDVAQRDHQELVDELEKVVVHDVAAGRGLAEAEVVKRLAKGPFLAGEARAARLIDTLAYHDEIDRFAAEVMERPVRIVDDSTVQRAPERWGKEPKVALIYLSGDMVDGDSQFIPLVNIKLAGSYTIARALKRARDDDSVKSVVFRIETGGGSSLAADVILREAMLTAKKKPLVVSMGTSAASGGYYAAVAGHPIFANRATVTGSIGIFYGKADVVGLLDKLGVRVEQFRAAPRADAESFFRPFTDDERAELGVKVKQFYDLFVGRVSEGRRMTPEAVDAVARGKVWTGQQARGIGLVDRLGGLRDALAEARRLGRLSDDSPIAESPEEDDSILGFLLNLVGLRISAGGPLGSLPAVLMPFAQMLSPFLVFESGKPLARAELMEETSSDDGERP